MLVRPTVDSKTISKISKLVDLPIHLDFENSLILLIDKFEKLQSGVAK